MRPEESSPRYCLACGYNIHGLTENRCPECGRDFNPEDPTTYATPEQNASRSRPLTADQLFYQKVVFAFVIIGLSIQVLAFIAGRWSTNVYEEVNGGFFVVCSIFSSVALLGVSGLDPWIKAIWLVLFLVFLVFLTGMASLFDEGFPVDGVVLLVILSFAASAPLCVHRKRWSGLVAVLLIFNLLLCADYAINIGLPVGYYGRMNATKSYVASFPGVKAIDVDDGYSGYVKGRPWRAGFWVEVIVNGNVEKVQFSYTSLWWNCKEADAWYATVKARATQPASGPVR